MDGWMDGWIGKWTHKKMDYRQITKWTDSLTTEDRQMNRLMF